MMMLDGLSKVGQRSDHTFQACRPKFSEGCLVSPRVRFLMRTGTFVFVITPSLVLATPQRNNQVMVVLKV